jgi:NADH-quinone oxidoreductase subunit J
MDISPVFFYFFAGLAIACALLTVLKKSAIACAFSLVLVFFAFAGIYALLDAHLIAALQVLVYAGAIMVLFVFVIMLLNADAPTFDLAQAHPVTRGVALLGSVTLLGLFVWAFKNTAVIAKLSDFTVEKVEAAGGNTRVISELMFSQYILPFELTSVLLLGSIVGAVALAKRKMT